MIKYILFLLLSLTFVFGWFSCVDDTNKEDEVVKIDIPALVSNYWSCEKAERNGRPAASLDGLFFDFSKDSLQTNMMGEVNVNPYSIKGDTIFQKGDHPVKYAIAAIDSARMQLNMEMNETKFSFFLKKTEKN